jgi:type IV secretory pathway VirB2 component (pilin)
MQKNEGTLDRGIRAIIGVAILYLAYSSMGGWMQIVGYVIGVVMLLTAATGVCCLYSVFKINTNK